MKAVIDVGAPWYTSGVHMWKGTAETLKPKPTRSRPTAVSARASVPVRPARARATSPIFVVPVAPYAMAMPKSRKAEENAPSRKYFIAASLESVRKPKAVRT